MLVFNIRFFPHHQPGEQGDELLPAQRGADVVRSGPGETTLLQPLGQHDHARAIEVNNLDPVAPTVGEGKERAGFWIFAQLLLGGIPQAIETHSQIARGRGNKHLELRVKTQDEVLALRDSIRLAANSTWLAH